MLELALILVLWLASAVAFARSAPSSHHGCGCLLDHDKKH